MLVKTVLVLFGGVSTEHLISGRSAYNIICALEKAGVKVIPVGITKTGAWLHYKGDYKHIRDGDWQEQMADQPKIMSTSFPLSVRDWICAIAGEEPDCIFPAVHGINCEDGTLQGLLQLSALPYVGCGVLASAAGMDKVHSKRIFEWAGLPQCKYVAVSRDRLQEDKKAVILQIEQEIGYPCFLKPNRGGSSVGTGKASSRAELAKMLAYVADFDTIILVEQFLQAREIELAVMGVKGRDKPLTGVIGEVATDASIAYYDYETKYFSASGADILLPAPIDQEQADRIHTYALKAWQALACSGLARIDFFLTAAGEIYINEINTMPGFTPISIFPQAFAKAGWPIEKLIAQLCELAVEEYRANERRELI